VNIDCYVKQPSNTTSFRETLSWWWRGWKSSVSVVPTATTRILHRRFPGTYKTVGQMFKFVWRWRWKINVVCMSSPFVSFQSRFVTYLLTFPRNLSLFTANTTQFSNVGNGFFYVRFKQISVFTRRSVASEAHIWSRVCTCESCGKVTLGLYILQVLRLSPDSMIPTMLHIHLILNTDPRKRRYECSAGHFKHPVLFRLSGRFGRKVSSHCFFAFRVF
jgi:hypothetical protein